MNATADLYASTKNPSASSRKASDPFRLIVVDDANNFFARHAPQPLFDG